VLVVMLICTNLSLKVSVRMVLCVYLLLHHELLCVCFNILWMLSIALCKFDGMFTFRNELELLAVVA
jgi:hypothetical protein